MHLNNADYRVIHNILLSVVSPIGSLLACKYCSYYPLWGKYYEYIIYITNHINSTHYNIYRLKWLIKDTIEEREDIQKEQKEKKRTNNIKNNTKNVTSNINKYCKLSSFKNINFWFIKVIKVNKTNKIEINEMVKNHLKF